MIEATNPLLIILSVGSEVVFGIHVCSKDICADIKLWKCISEIIFRSHSSSSESSISHRNFGPISYRFWNTGVCWLRIASFPYTQGGNCRERVGLNPYPSSRLQNRRMFLSENRL